MALLCAHMAESLAYRQGCGLPGFPPGLDEPLETTAEVLTPLCVGVPLGTLKVTTAQHPPRLSGLGCSLDTGTCERFPGDPKGSQVGNPTLNTFLNVSGNKNLSLLKERERGWQECPSSQPRPAAGGGGEGRVILISKVWETVLKIDCM